MYLKMDAFSTGKIHFTFLSDLFVQTISDGGETIQSLACGRGGIGLLATNWSSPRPSLCTAFHCGAFGETAQPLSKLTPASP